MYIVYPRYINFAGILTDKYDSQVTELDDNR